MGICPIVNMSSFYLGTSAIAWHSAKCVELIAVSGTSTSQFLCYVKNAGTASLFLERALLELS